MYLQCLIAFCLFFLASLPVKASNPVMVYAASSLTLALNEIVEHYAPAPKHTVLISYGASSSLARQLLHGAPAEIYISANSKWMDYANQHGVIREQMPWLTNQLVLIGEKSLGSAKNFQIQTLKNKLGEQRLAIADPSHVPLGIYSQQSLKTLGLWQDVKTQLAYANNARAALALVERGEASFGIIYNTDARSAKNVETLYHFPASSHEKILYSVALTKMATKNAEQFYDYLYSKAAKTILMRYGFTLVEKETPQ